MKKNELTWDEKLAKFYDETGYAEVEMYHEPDENLMNYMGISQYATHFNLKEGDILAIIKALKQSAAFQRASQKSMTTSKTNTVIGPNDEFADDTYIFKDTESLIQTRQAHMEEVAIIAKMIAKALGVNGDFSYIIGLIHDIGHTPEGHFGERVFSSIARLNNCGYVVHNAMGAYVAEREGIIENAEKEVLEFNEDADPEEVKRFMRYVIDGVVSHNGEGTVGKIIPENKSTEKMIEEIRRCFTQKGYDRKIMPATIEGAIIRYADILAYTRSDLLDGFRLRDERGNKILNGFNDDYLALIGTVIAKKNNYNKMLTLENKFLLELYGLTKRINYFEFKSKTPNDFLELERLEKEREIIRKKYDEFCEYKIEYAKEYISNLKPSEVKTKISSTMQNVFIKDLVETSKDKDFITMSPLMRRTFFALRDLNFRYIVPYTRRGYLAEFPIPTNRLVNIFSEGLMKRGIVYDAIPDDVKERYGIKRKYENVKEDDDAKKPKIDYEVKMYHYYDNLPEDKISEIYHNSMRALYDITEHDIRIAFGEEEYDGELKETYENEKIVPIREKINELGLHSKTEEGRIELLDELIGERIKNIEKIIASKMAIEYLGGMTDNTLIAVLLNRGLLSREQLIKKYGRPSKNVIAKEFDQGLTQLQNSYSEALNGLIKPDDIPEEEITL